MNQERRQRVARNLQTDKEKQEEEDKWMMHSFYHRLFEKPQSIKNVGSPFGGELKDVE